jgi:hypothetical protein
MIDKYKSAIHGKEKTFTHGQKVQVKIMDKKGKTGEWKRGFVVGINPPRPRKMISTRYDVSLEDCGTTLHNVDPEYMRDLVEVVEDA